MSSGSAAAVAQHRAPYARALGDTHPRPTLAKFVAGGGLRIELRDADDVETVVVVAPPDEAVGALYRSELSAVDCVEGPTVGPAAAWIQAVVAATRQAETEPGWKRSLARLAKRVRRG